MATSVVFTLIPRLVTVFDSVLSNVNVTHGYMVSEDPGNFLLVGVDDPDSSDRSPASEGSQKWAGLGANTSYEEGTVACCALSWNGQGDLAAALASLAETTAAIESALRDDPNLGGQVPGLNWVKYGSRWRLEENQATDGAEALIFFELAFKARLAA